MKNKLSICVFIKDNNEGAFGLWESMATLMPIADEFFVLDLGSTDGTYEILKDLASKNKKIRLEQGEFPINPVTNLVDAGSFAELPNAMIPTCKNDLVMYYQADEIWHEDLLKMMVKRLEDLKNFKGLSFWRYQLQNNFQSIKWSPHLVHRVDFKDQFIFVEDGMNTGKTFDAEIVGNYGGEYFTRWGAEFMRDETETVNEQGELYIYGSIQRPIQKGKHPYEMPTNEMILDISSIGGFLENIISKRKKHAPMWRESNEGINIGGRGYNLQGWYNQQKKNPDWTRTDTKFNIPEIMKPLLGQTRYPVRQDILDKIANS
jgi:glycosyltransferase involved in cell wall biosynthesis